MKHIRLLALLTALLLISVSVCAQCEITWQTRNCAGQENCGSAGCNTLPRAQFGCQPFHSFRFSCPAVVPCQKVKPSCDGTEPSDTQEEQTEPQKEQPGTKPESKPEQTKPQQSEPETKPEQTGTTMSAMESELIRQVNAERAKNGLGALKVSSELMNAAKIRGMEIVTSFSHTRPDGSSWSTVSGAARGENIAMGQQTVDKVMAAWMSSSGHRANILRGSFGSIGVCAYKQGNVMYWVQLFGQ